MNLVDSSAWLEYFANGPNAKYFAPAIEAAEKLIVPSICVYEVFKRILQQRSEDAALQAVAAMKQGAVVATDFTMSLNAAKISVELKLPMADSYIIACARQYGAVIWTQDSDFDGLENVKFYKKK